MAARLLALSSQVAVGRVGLSAISAVCCRMGVELIALPTVSLSNHAGWPAVAGRPTALEDLSAQIEAIDANGWLDAVDTVLSGYFPSADHAAFAAEWIARARVRKPGLRYVCDPVLGDWPKGLYVPPAVAETIRDALAPQADLVTPNRFELAWLADRAVEDMDDAVEAADALGVGAVWATSTPCGGDALGVLEVVGAEARIVGAPMLAGAPNGAGDALSALAALGDPVGLAAARVHAMIRASAGRAHLAVVESDAWLDAPPFEARPVAR